MQSQPSPKPPSGCEAQCPDCGATLSRLADMNRHRKNKHPDGTETIFRCPVPACHYESRQKANLKAHHNAKHSNGRQYSCNDCSRRFTDAAARIRHRKRVHGYEPYHTADYVARKALGGEKRAVQEADEDVPNKRRCQRAPSPTTYDLPDTPSSVSLPRDLLKFAHHDGFWKMLVQFARDTAERRGSQHSLPFANLPGSDAPPELSLLEDSIPPAAQFLSSTTSSDPINNYSGFLDPRLDATPLQEEALTSQFTQDSAVRPAIPSDYAPYPFPNENDTTTLPASGGPEIFPGVGFPNQFPDPSMYPYHDIPPFIPIYNGLSSTTPSPASILPQLDFFTGGPTQDPEWDAWCQLNLAL